MALNDEIVQVLLNITTWFEGDKVRQACVGSGDKIGASLYYIQDTQYNEN